MSTTFLRVELVTRTPDATHSPMLINVDHIVRIVPHWPAGTIIVTTDDVSLHIHTSLDELHQQMIASGGRITVKWIGLVAE